MTSLILALGVFGQCIGGTCPTTPNPTFWRFPVDSTLRTANQQNPSTGVPATPVAAIRQDPIYGAPDSVCYIYSIGLDGSVASVGVAVQLENGCIVVTASDAVRRGAIHAVHIGKTRTICRKLFSDDQLTVLTPRKQLQGAVPGTEITRQVTVYAVDNEHVIRPLTAAVSQMDDKLVIYANNTIGVGAAVFNSKSQLVGVVTKSERDKFTAVTLEKLLDTLRNMKLEYPEFDWSK